MISIFHRECELNKGQEKDLKIINESVEMVSLDKLSPHPSNPRKGNVQDLARSFQVNGFYGVIVAQRSTGHILAGNHRLMAAREEGADEIPVAWVDCDDEEARRILLADNRLSDLATYDDDALLALLEDLAQTDLGLDGTGYDDSFLDELAGESNAGTSGNTDPDEVPAPPPEPVTKMGDLWLLGDHRLLCGDSTSVQHVERLVGQDDVDMIFTDPPYNVAFNGRSGKFDVIKNDDLQESEFVDFIKEVCSIISQFQPDCFYVWCNWKFYGVLQALLPFKGCIVWAKNVFGLGRGYRHQHEFCLYNARIDDSIKNESDLWEVAKDSKYVHPTQKPVALSQRALRNHASSVFVLDLFGGSGSTLIGCEMEGRKARLMELDPIYCDVIVRRWEEFTGRKAVLAESACDQVSTRA